MQLDSGSPFYSARNDDCIIPFSFLSVLGELPSSSFDKIRTTPWQAVVKNIAFIIIVAYPEIKALSA